MAKILLVFLLALFALQGTNSAALTKQNVLGDVVQELSQELHKLAIEINGRLFQLTEEFGNEFAKIFKEANFDQIFDNLREEVAKLNSEDTSIDFCGETAVNDIEALEHYLQVHTFTCKYQVDGEFDVLKTKLETLVQRIRNLNNEFARDVFVCMKQSQGSSNAFGECLKLKVENIKIQMNDIQKIVLDTLNEVESSFDFVKDKLSKCVLMAKTEVEQMAETIVNKMKSCVQDANKNELYMVKKNNFFDVIKELTDKVNNISSELNTRMLQLIDSFAEKFNKIVKEANFEYIITGLRNEVGKLSGEDISLDFCEEVAGSEIELLSKLIKEHTFTCKYEVNADFDNLLKSFKNVFERVFELNNKISRDFIVCMKESHGNAEQFSKCLKPKVEAIKVELDEVEKEVLKTLDEVEKSLDLVMGKVSECVLKAKKDVEDKAQLIIDSMKKCIQKAVFTQQRNVPTIQDAYKLLADKIQEEELTVTVNLPEEITTFSDKVNIIVSNHNIEVLIVKIKEQVEELLYQSNKDTTECKLEVTSKVDLLVSDSQSALEQCVSDVQLVADDLEKQFKVLAEKSAVLADELSNNILVCAQEYPTNVIGFSKCLIERAESLKDKVVELQEEVDKTMTLALETTKEAVQSLNKCMDKVEDETSIKGQLVIEDLQKCIRNLDNKSQQESAESIQNYYKILANKIQEEEMTVTVNLPKEITTFSDKVNIIVSNHNIEVLIVKIKEQVEELLSQSNKDTTECKLEVTSKVDLLVSDSQSALEQCVSDVQLVADDLEKQFNVLAEKSTVLADELSNNILVCAQEYPTNVIGFSKCLIERAESLKDKVVELQEEVDKTMTLALETTKEAVQSLNKCMDKVEDETTTKGQLVIEDLQKCIRNLDLLF